MEGFPNKSFLSRGELGYVKLLLPFGLSTVLSQTLGVTTVRFRDEDVLLTTTLLTTTYYFLLLTTTYKFLDFNLKPCLKFKTSRKRWKISSASCG